MLNDLKTSAPACIQNTYCELSLSVQIAAVKQLEESKTKIENLLDWLSNVDKDSERAGIKQRQVIEQNGTHFQEGDGKSAIGEEDEVNGNLLETDVDGQVGTTEENLNQQYQKVKVGSFKHTHVVKFCFSGLFEEYLSYLSKP